MAECSSTLVELKPVTGRTHQLRVHMAAIGHPILGDTLYAPDEVQAAAPRLCLHAHSISFKHPVTGAPMSLSSPQCPFASPSELALLNNPTTSATAVVEMFEGAGAGQRH